MKGLTKRQRTVLDFIEKHIETKRISPTFREIMHHFHFASLGSVYRHIEALKAKGWITSESNTPRSLSPQKRNQSKEEASSVELPLIGLVRAGYPIETFNEIHLISVPAKLVPKPAESYVLKVYGNALKEEQICEEDLLIIEARSNAQPGEMALILVNSQETVLKRYYPDGPFVRLEALNAAVRPMIMREENLEIQGVLIALIRQFAIS